MPAANNDRKHNKRELDRAIGNITWSIQHIEGVKENFVNAATQYAVMEQDVPDSYVETINNLSEISAALVVLGSLVNKVNETI